MQLTRFSDYALRTLIFTALKDGERATISEIAAAYDISRNHLMKVVTRLVSLGYLKGIRGKHGGLLLNREAEEISVGQLIREMEPDLDLVECFRPDSQCCIQPACRLNRMLDEALAAFLGVLDQYTLTDILAPEADLRRLLNLEIPVRNLA